MICLQLFSKEQSSAEKGRQDRSRGNDGEQDRGVFQPRKHKGQKICNAVCKPREYTVPFPLGQDQFFGRVPSECQDRANDRAEKHGKQHKFLTVCFGIQRLMLLLQDRADAVAQKRDPNKQKPYDTGGFADEKYFSSVFKRTYGYSPSLVKIL